MVRATTNNGIRGYIIENDNYLNDAQTLSFAQDTFTVFYQKEKYYTGNKVKVLKPIFAPVTEKILRFIVACFQCSLQTLSWGTGSTVSSIEDIKVSMPTNNGEIDFDFMENFVAELESRRVAELESRRVAELETYLLATGLKDYVLTVEEENIIKNYQDGKIVLSQYLFKDIFNNIKQGRRLKKDDQEKGNIPFVMSGTTNTGIVGYISNPIVVFPKNSITIDIFGNAFYRNFEFGAGDDTGAYWNTKIDYSKEEMLFFAASIGRTLSGKFSYGKKLRSSQSYNFKMYVIDKDDKPDFESMKTFISAIQKLVIKDVVLYADSKIKATKSVIGSIE